jgi:site-specific DNA recombinase
MIRPGPLFKSSSRPMCATTGAGPKLAEPSLLAGLLVDARGERLTPSHAVKKGRRYRYYVSAALITAGAKDDTPSWRLAAQEIEECVIRILVDALTSPAKLLDRLRLTGMPSEQVRKILGRAGRLAAALRGSPAERAKIDRASRGEPRLAENVRVCG